jgi:hypothetical protein
MKRTAFIVILVLTAAFVFSLVMTRRLISTWHPEPTTEAVK